MIDKTYVISQSSVSHFYTQFCTNAEKSRDKIIRSKNPLLVKLKCTQKNELEYSIKWYPKVSQTQAHARRNTHQRNEGWEGLLAFFSCSWLVAEANPFS